MANDCATGRKFFVTVNSVALENGVTETELKGLITHVVFYAGWPCAVNAGRIAIDVFGQK